MDSASQYLLSLAEELSREVAWNHCPVRFPVVHLRQVQKLANDIRTAGREGLTFKDWKALWGRYSALAKETGSLLNNAATVADRYPSMQAFWDDLEAQKLGNTNTTVWDTYEHGRRRQLEALCADCYGAEAAILVNSGMAAILCVILSCQGSPARPVVMGTQSYFETTELVEQVFGRRENRVVKVPVGRPSSVLGCLRKLQPTLVLLETAVNYPDGPLPCDFIQWHKESPTTVFVVDNSVQGPLTQWFDLAPSLRDRLLVVESATKYLTQGCMAGVVYGGEALVAECRAMARTAGLLLQSCAFNYVREGEIRYCLERMRLHSRNARLFVECFGEAIGETGSLLKLTTIGDGNPSSSLVQRGVGAPVFLSPSAPGKSLPYHAILGEWQEKLAAEGFCIPIRGGFGWAETSARVYESSVLNLPDGPEYLRISVGLELEVAIRSYAASLATACRAAVREEP